MDQPLVSIIIPVYNSEKYLAESVNSALAQTWPNIEVIVVDDGSTDNSLAIAKGFESDKVKVYSQQNKGASAARNKGLSEARGDYIQFLDADDLISADKIAAQVKILEVNKNKIAVCSTVHFNDNLLTTYHKPSAYEDSFLIDSEPKAFLFNLLGGNSYNGSMITVHAWLVSAEIIKEAGFWDEELTVNDDGEFYFRVLLKTQGVLKTQGLVYYRKSNSNLSVSTLKSTESFKAGINAIHKIKENLNKYFSPAEICKCFYRIYMEYAIRCFPQNKLLSAHCVAEAKKLCFEAKIKPELKIAIGGKFIDFMANRISWKLARYIQYHGKKQG